MTVRRPKSAQQANATRFANRPHSYAKGHEFSRAEKTFKDKLGL
jgi:hypothetical protein